MNDRRLIDSKIQLLTHKMYLDPNCTPIQALHVLQDLFTTHQNAGAFFARESSRTRARHYVLFTLEPLFILCSIARELSSNADLDPEEPDQHRYLPLLSNETRFDLCENETHEEPTFCFKPLTSDKESRQWINENLFILLQYANSIPPSLLEMEDSNDTRYKIRIRWFEKILGRWRSQKDHAQNGNLVGDFGRGRDRDGEGKYDILDGSPWEAGWLVRDRLMWDLL